MTIPERLATVEANIDHILQEMETAASMRQDMIERLETMTSTLATLEKEISRYKGFIGGVTFVVSCLGMFFYKFGIQIYDFLTKAKGM